MSTEESESLMLVLEPECAALAVYVGTSELGYGSRFMVLNCGSGMVNISVHDTHSVNPLQLATIAPPTGGPWGDNTVNEEFQKFLAELLGPELYALTDDPCRAIAIFHISLDFEKLRMDFNPSKQPRFLRLIDFMESKDQLAALAKVWNSNHPDKPILMTPQLRSSILPMSNELMLSFYEPSLSAIVDKIRREMCNNGAIRDIFLVGGYGTDKVLTHRIMKEFHFKFGMTVIPLQPVAKAEEAVAMGAVYFGWYRGVFQSRVAACSYSVVAIGARDTTGTSSDRLETIVREGEVVPVNHVVTLSALPVQPEQGIITWRLYRSREGQSAPELVTDAIFLGAFHAPCPPQPDNMQMIKPTRLLLRFGAAELQVTALDSAMRKTRLTLGF